MAIKPLNDYVHVEVENNLPTYKFASRLNYVGAVGTINDLWTGPEPKVGEIRFVLETGANYVWIGNNWEMLYDYQALRPAPMETPRIDYIRPTYPDPTLDFKGIWHLIKCFFNYNFVRLGWNVQLG